jgi:hypothetical protein
MWTRSQGVRVFFAEQLATADQSVSGDVASLLVLTQRA